MAIYLVTALVAHALTCAAHGGGDVAATRGPAAAIGVTQHAHADPDPGPALADRSGQPSPGEHDDDDHAGCETLKQALAAERFDAAAPARPAAFPPAPAGQAAPALPEPAAQARAGNSADAGHPPRPPTETRLLTLVCVART